MSASPSAVSSDVVVVLSTAPPPPPDTASDAAIAAALAEDGAGASRKASAVDDDDPTRDDAALAWALQEAEAASSTAGAAAPAGASSLARAASEGPPPPWRAVLERVAAARVADAPVRAHVPRLAAFFGGDAAVEHDRLQATLAAYGLAEHRVVGDGACQFRSLSHQLFGREDYHPAVRATVVAQLAARPDLYAGFVVGGGGGDDYGAYVARMARPAEWGDHVTLQAAADALRSRVVVISTYHPNPIINVEPNEEGGGGGKHGAPTQRTLFVSFWAEVHFNSVLPAGSAGRSAGGRPATTPERVRRWFAANF